MSRVNLRGLPTVVDPYDPDSVAVYRLFNRWGALLYVGIAADPKNRLLQHECEKDWWCHVFSRTITWYPNRTEAALEESRAIVHEMPAYNIAGAQPCPKITVAELVEGWRPSAANLDLFFIRRVREWSLCGISEERREYGRVVREAHFALHDRARRGARLSHYQFIRRWDEDQERRRAQELQVRTQFCERIERRAEAERVRLKRSWAARYKEEKRGEQRASGGSARGSSARKPKSARRRST